MSAVDLLTDAVFAAAKVSVLVAMAATLAVSLRRAPAAARHRVWMAALIGALLLPLVTIWVPSWSLWTLPAPAVERQALDLALPVPSAGTSPVMDEGVWPCADCSGATPAVTVAPSRSWWASTLSGIRSVGSRLSGIPLAICLLSLWLAGAAMILLRLGRAMLSVRRLERAAVPVEKAWSAALDDARDRVGVRREVRLLRSPEIDTPMTWGALRPVILLPESSRHWGEERREIVLHHELSHVRRCDWLVRLLARGICALYWLNPLVWLAGRRLVLEQEKACDEAVVALGNRPSSYAQHILAIAASVDRRSRSPLLALDMARRSQMEGRLMSILDGSRSSHRRRGLLIPVLLLIGLVPALAAVDPWTEEEILGVPLPEETVDAGPDGGARSDIAPGSASGEAATGVPPSVDTSGVSRLLAELTRIELEMVPLERQMEAFASEMELVEEEMEAVEELFEPFEKELEAHEAELEPFEERLETLELELKPYEGLLEAVEAGLEVHESHLAAFEDELGPYEDLLEGVEAELEPYEERLEQLEAELGPYEDRLEAIEDELEPFEDQLEALGDAMEPLDDEMDELDDRYNATDSVEERERLRARMREIDREMGPIREKMQAVHEEMGPVHEQMRAIHEEMGPVHERMRAIHEEMQPIYERMRAIHEQMQPVHERMRAIHEEMQPVYERMRSVHEEMRPVYERMRAIHEEMQPLHEQMNGVHERMRPVHEAIGEHHERMKPHDRKLEDIHERMQPLHEEMSIQHDALERELIEVVERMLAADLGPVLAPGADLSKAASQIIDESSIRIDRGRLRMYSSIPVLRGLLREHFAPGGGGPAFEAALEDFLEAYSNLEIDAA